MEERQLQRRQAHSEPPGPAGPGGGRRPRRAAGGRPRHGFGASQPRVALPGGADGAREPRARGRGQPSHPRHAGGQGKVRPLGPHLRQDRGVIFRFQVAGQRVLRAARVLPGLPAGRRLPGRPGEDRSGLPAHEPRQQLLRGRHRGGGPAGRRRHHALPGLPAAAAAHHAAAAGGAGRGRYVRHQRGARDHRAGQRLPLRGAVRRG
mmetsp:Transcript_11610/g.31501  ORF Transcript_11610/g.31501 Transcript_11610/m.31501 type:complete len:206 (-) Transcript_11610:725-1342(-)